MLLRTVLVTLFALPALISGNQFPIFNGAVGGVLSPGIQDCKSSKAIFSNIAPTLTPGKLRVVENSGICETTSGVYQASGYGDISANKSVWFWFFAARKNPNKAPLITFFNGGPGSSSMIGLFQENGPCRINNDSTAVHHNPTSWNNVANVLYIDQPIGAGFSYGTENIDSSHKAAVDVWKFLQIWFEDSRFSKYGNRKFGLWTESYGGHFGPIFAAYFLQQNAAIRLGKVKGLPINLKALGIGNGFIDPLTQYPGNIQYAQSNPYHPLVNSSVIAAANATWSETGGCRDQIIACNNGGSNAVCYATKTFCDQRIIAKISGIWDIFYVPTAKPDPYPPQLSTYLHNSTVTSKIGSQIKWEKRNNHVYAQFAKAGDWMRSTLPELETVIDSGVRTVLYDGDADFFFNYKGVEAMTLALNTTFSALFKKQKFATFDVKGKPAGLYKNAGTFSYLRVFGAGHEVPAYEWRDVARGAAALQMFTQIMSDHPLSST